MADEAQSSRNRRSILHVDMDAFYAAIEQRDRPELRGKPVVVGAPPDRRGVVATASYEARKFGIHSAMPSRTAGKLCPHAIFVEPRMESYEKASEQIMKVFEEFTPIIEQVSIDEAFLDVSGCLSIWPSAAILAAELKARIRSRLSLTASVGVASNKFLAKLASDLEKPDGLTIVPREPDQILTFLAPLPVRKIWGVGKVGEKALNDRGIQTIGQLQAIKEQDLAKWFGESFANHLWTLSRGLDDRPVESGWEEKSISNENTFDEDCKDPEIWRQTLIELAEHVGMRLRASGKMARTIDIKVRFEDFTTLSRQTSLDEATDTDRDLRQAVLSLFEKLKVNKPIRLLGVGVSKLGVTDSSAGDQPLLFPELEKKASKEKDRSLDNVVDSLRKKLGPDAVKRGNWKAGRRD